ncbi:MAG: hypothetical protein NVS3B21_06360 [Acidimicrobiales bacterium]
MPGAGPASVPIPRQVMALVVAALAAALGALILGEYEQAGATPYIAGVLFGLAVAELVLTVAHRGTVPLAAGAALVSAGGLGWAAWISSGSGIAPVPAVAYAGVSLGAIVAGAWVAVSGRGRGPRSTTGPRNG